LKPFTFPQMPDPERFTRRLAELRLDYRRKTPPVLASQTGSSWVPDGADSGYFHLKLWNRPIKVSYPDGLVFRDAATEPSPPMEQALLLYYFTLADGSPLHGNWISFSELPDGKFYNQAFQGYTGKEIARAFENDMGAFQTAAENLGGERQELADRSYRFIALPRVPLVVAYWIGDEDFPASAQVLFDGSAGSYLTTDSFAILGSNIAHRLIAAKPHLSEN